MAQPYLGAGANYLMGSAAPVTGQDVSQYYNPMANQVMSQLQNIFGNQMRTLTGNVTQQAGGVGADRIGVAQSNLANQQGLAAGQTMANLYYPALQAAQQQRQMMAGAGFGLGQLGPAAQTSQLQGIQALLGAGGQQQGLAQAMMNAQYQQQLGQIAYPFQTGQYLAGITGGLAPAMGGQTTGAAQTTQTPAQPSGLAQGLGLGTAGIGALGSLGSAMPGTGVGKGSTPSTNYFSPFGGNIGGSTTSGNAIWNRGGKVEGFQFGGNPGVSAGPTQPIGQSATTAANVIAPSAEEQAQLNAIYGTIPNLNALPAGASTYANQFAAIPQLPGLTPLQTTGLGPNSFNPLTSQLNRDRIGESQFWHMSPQQLEQMFAASPSTGSPFGTFQQGGRAGVSPAPGMAPWGPPFQQGGVTDDDSSIPGVSVQSPSGAGIPGASPPKVGGLTPIPMGKLQPGPGKSGLYGQYLSPFGSHQQTAGGSQSTPASEAMQGMQLASALGRLPGMSSMFGGSGVGAAGAGMPLDLSAAGAGAGDVGAATAAGKGATAGLEEAAPLVLMAQSGGAIDDYPTIGPGAPKERIPLPRPRPDVPVEFYPKGPYVHDFLKGVGGSPDWRQGQRQIASGGTIEGYQDAGFVDPLSGGTPETMAPLGDPIAQGLIQGAQNIERTFPGPDTPKDQSQIPTDMPLPRSRPTGAVDPFGSKPVRTTTIPASEIAGDPIEGDVSTSPAGIWSDSSGDLAGRTPTGYEVPANRGQVLRGSASAPGAQPPRPGPYSPRQTVGSTAPFGDQSGYDPTTPYQAQRGMNFAQRMAASPFFPLIGAGAAMATTATPGQRGFGAIGSVLGTGLGAYAKGVEGQRKSLDTEDAQNQKAQHLEDMAAQHLRDFQLRSDIAEQRDRTAKEREDRLRDKEEAAGYGRPPNVQDIAKEVYADPTWSMGKQPDQIMVEIQRRYQERLKIYQDSIRNRGAPAPPAAPPATPTTPPAAPGPAPPTSQARPPGVPANAGYSPSTGKWYLPDGTVVG
jgi:hypothetical protein